VSHTYTPYLAGNHMSTNEKLLKRSTRKYGVPLTENETVIYHSQDDCCSVACFEWWLWMGSWLPKPCFPLGYLIGIPLNLPFQLLFTPYLFCCYSLPLACSQKFVSSTFTCCFPPLISCFETFQIQGSDQQKGVSRS
jgi:hypothetical protein